jgi:hypothetical protein
MPQIQVTTTDLTYAGRTIGAAVITISREGQEGPGTSDLVDVRVELELPAASAEAPGTLHPELQFGSRVNVFGADLDANWSDVPGKVARRASYSGTDYTTLFSQADSYATTELGKLSTALADRQAALDAAG